MSDQAIMIVDRPRAVARRWSHRFTEENSGLKEARKCNRLA
jgi:hypothetical protein